VEIEEAEKVEEIAGVAEVDLKLLEYKKKAARNKRRDCSWLARRADSRSLTRSLSEANRTVYTEFHVTTTGSEELISKGSQMNACHE
jgi:hypothetical protein